MKTVKIPDNTKPTWSVTINGVKYGPYPSGAVMSIPDPAAAAAQHYWDSLPKEDPPETTEQMIRRICNEMLTAYLPKVAFDLSEVALTSTRVDITSIISRKEFQRLFFDGPGYYKELLPDVSVWFTYDDVEYQTSDYYVEDHTYVHFLAHQVEDGAVTALIDLCIDMETQNRVYAAIHVTSLTDETTEG